MIWAMRNGQHESDIYVCYMKPANGRRIGDFLPAITGVSHVANQIIACVAAGTIRNLWSLMTSYMNCAHDYNPC
jgi:hypothetical protein